MCRLFGAAASAPIDVSFELLRSDNSILRQSESHDSGWGSAYYSEDGEPDVRRFPEAAHADEAFDEVTSGRSRLIMVHVRRATIGDLKLENTHPFSTRALHLLPQRHDPEGVAARPPRGPRPARRHRLGAVLQPADDRLRPG